MKEIKETLGRKASVAVLVMESLCNSGMISGFTTLLKTGWLASHLSTAYGTKLLILLVNITRHVFQKRKSKPSPKFL